MSKTSYIFTYQLPTDTAKEYALLISLNCYFFAYLKFFAFISLNILVEK